MSRGQRAARQIGVAPIAIQVEGRTRHLAVKFECPKCENFLITCMSESEPYHLRDKAG